MLDIKSNSVGKKLTSAFLYDVKIKSVLSDFTNFIQGFCTCDANGVSKYEIQTSRCLYYKGLTVVLKSWVYFRPETYWNVSGWSYRNINLNANAKRMSAVKPNPWTTPSPANMMLITSILVEILHRVATIWTVKRSMA